MTRPGNISVGRGRLLLYAVGFPLVIALDIITPVGVADWLLELILVWIASLAGSRKELRAVAAISTVTMLLGLWSSPSSVVPFWMGVVNRLVAIVVIWTMVHTAERRRSAEEAERATASQIRILHGLLPICAGCKSIRDTSGNWQKLETYLSMNSEVTLTHGYCPACSARYMDESQQEPPNGQTPGA